ncbi:MAG: alkene reductase [Massilia sp.]|nr:alkene reductase [Massilia sp.]
MTFRRACPFVKNARKYSTALRRTARRRRAAKTGRPRREFAGSLCDAPTQYWVQRASAGAGAILSQAASVTPMGVGCAETPGIRSDAQVEGAKQVTGGLHVEACRTGAENAGSVHCIAHAGTGSFCAAHGGCGSVRTPPAPQCLHIHTGYVRPVEASGFPCDCSSTHDILARFAWCAGWRCTR